MSVPYFNTSARRAALLFISGKWKGTPWCPNSGVMGVGVSCHNLPIEIYIYCGAFPQDMPKVFALPSEATAKNIMEPLLDARPELVRLKEGEPLQAGDLIGLWLARDDNGNRVRTRHTNHLGIVLDEFWFVHVLTQKNTDFDLKNVSPWLERIVAAWRPIEHEQRPNQ